MTNTFKKACQGVYAMLSDDATLQHGDEATITTKHGKEVLVIVWKRLKEYTDGTALYSVIRDDGMNRKAFQAKKAERYEKAAERQERLSNEYYEKSNKHRDFLVLAEPIKIGHHSEKRHRKLYEDNWRNMGKSVQASDKAKEYEQKAEGVQYQINKEINLDTPDALPLLVQRVEALEQQRRDLKASGNYQSYQLSNLAGNIKRYKERLDLAFWLWEIDPEKEKAHKEARNPAPKPKKEKAPFYNEKDMQFLGIDEYDLHVFLVKTGRKYAHFWKCPIQGRTETPVTYYGGLYQVEKLDTIEATYKDFQRAGGHTIGYQMPIPSAVIRPIMDKASQPCP